MALLTLVLLFRTQQKPLLPRRIFAPVLILLALMAASALWAIDPAGALEQTLKAAPVLLGGALLIALAQNPNAAGADFFARVFPLAVALGGLGVMAELYGSDVLHVLHHDETPVNLSKFNRSVLTFTLLAVLALPMLFQGGAKKPAAFLCAVLALVLYRTDSQSAQLAFFIGAGLYFLFPYTHRRAWQATALALAALTLAAPFLAQWMFRTLPDQAAHFSWLQNGFASSRMEIWDFISRRALERPLTGFGVEATRHITDFDTAMRYQQTKQVLHPHNIVLQLWIEFGAIGAVLGAAFFVHFIKTIRETGPVAARLIFPAWGAALSASAMSYGLWQGWWLGLLAFLIAGGAAIVKMQRFSPTLN